MGRAFALEADAMVFGSLICRVSGPDDWAAAEQHTNRANKTRQVFRIVFIVTSIQSAILPAFCQDSPSHASQRGLFRFNFSLPPNSEDRPHDQVADKLVTSINTKQLHALLHEQRAGQLHRGDESEPDME